MIKKKRIRNREPGGRQFSTLWNPEYQVHVKSIESVQRKFLRILAYKSGTRIIDHNYDDIMKDQEIVTLKDRRIMQDLIFLFKLIHNEVYSPELLYQLNFKVNTKNTRNKDIFKLKKNRTNIGEFSPLNRLQILGNKASDVGFDLFQCNFLNEIKKVDCKLLC
uniref:Uncharacterized protein n=2 Tax=Cacopsylla melanoneura TaxID=428564 RepID=A0A8D9DUI3_9HEMI